MVEEQPKSGMNWWMGCGLGCAVLLLIMVVIVLALYGVISRRLDANRSVMQQDIREEYARLIEAGRVPEEHRPLFDDVIAQSQRPEAGTLGLALVLLAVIMPIEQDHLTEDDLRMVAAVRDLLAEDPSPGMISFVLFLQEHPELQERAAELEYHYTEPPEALEPEGEPVL